MATTMAGDGNGLEARLRALRANQPTLTALALATRSGLLLAADADDGPDAETLAALGADLLVSAQAPSRALAGGEPREVTVRGASAHVLAVAAGDSAVLVGLTGALTPTSGSDSHARLYSASITR